MKICEWRIPQLCQHVNNWRIYGKSVTINSWIITLTLRKYGEVNGTEWIRILERPSGLNFSRKTLPSLNLIRTRYRRCDTKNKRKSPAPGQDDYTGARCSSFYRLCWKLKCLFIIICNIIHLSYISSYAKWMNHNHD